MAIKQIESQFCREVSSIAYLNEVVRDKLVGLGYSAFSVFIENDKKNLLPDEFEIYESGMEELIKVSIANNSSSLSYWGGGSGVSPILDGFFKEFWQDDMGYWFSPLPWHIREWSFQKSNIEAYYSRRAALYLAMWDAISEESIRYFCDDLLLDFDRMVSELIVRANKFGFVLKKTNNVGVVFEKRTSSELSVFFDFRINRKEMSYPLQNGGAKAMEVYFYVKYKKSRGEVFNFPVAINNFGPYFDRAYRGFRNMPEFINAIEAHMGVYEILKENIDCKVYDFTKAIAG